MRERRSVSKKKPSRGLFQSERRAFVRFPSGREMFCEPVSAETAEEPEMAWLAQIRDVSAGGIGLILSRRFEPGTSLLLDLPHAGGTRRLLPVQILHMTPEGDGRWAAGCSFTYPLSEADLKLLQEAELQPAAEAPRHPHTPGADDDGVFTVS
jgi:hypothetical protein